MSVTKSNGSSSHAVAAGTTSAAPVYSTAIDLATKHGTSVDVTITNGAIGPTVGGQVQLEVSHDGSTWVARGWPSRASLTALAVESWAWEFNENAPQSLRFAAFGNVTQPVTLDVRWTAVDAVG